MRNILPLLPIFTLALFETAIIIVLLTNILRQTFVCTENCIGVERGLETLVVNSNPADSNRSINVLSKRR